MKKNLSIKSNPNYIIAESILTFKGRFEVQDIIELVKEDLIDTYDEDTIFEKVEDKIEALWKARMLVYTGIDYYVDTKENRKYI